MKESIQIPDVTPEHVEALVRFLERSGITGYSGDHEGTVQGDCFAAEYRYDPASRLLVLDASEFPEVIRKAPAAVTARLFEKMVRSVMVSRRPGKCAVYDYVIPNIDNRSESMLTFSDSHATNGTIDISNTKIATGKVLEAFEADSTKGSTVGVGGTCKYTLADGQTVLSITYFLHTIGTHTFTAGLSGTNSGRYMTTLKDTDPVLDVYTYLTPTITLSKA